MSLGDVVVRDVRRDCFVGGDACDDPEPAVTLELEYDETDEEVTLGVAVDPDVGKGVVDLGQNVWASLGHHLLVRAAG